MPLGKMGKSLQNRERSSDRMQALNRFLSDLSAEEFVDRRLNVASGRYRSRFCNDFFFENVRPEFRADSN
jgi:hypothetical protein